jgi:hypothetical protein
MSLKKSFFFYKVGEQEGRTGCMGEVGGFALVGGRWQERGRRVNTVQ